MTIRPSGNSLKPNELCIGHWTIEYKEYKKARIDQRDKRAQAGDKNNFAKYLKVKFFSLREMDKILHRKNHEKIKERKGLKAIQRQTKIKYKWQKINEGSEKL